MVQITVYNNLTGCASLFISTSPERNPQIPADKLADALFRSNTLFIPSDNLVERKEAVMQIARNFAEFAGVAWCADWETRAYHIKYLQGVSLIYTKPHI